MVKEGDKSITEVEVNFVWQISFPLSNGASLGSLKIILCALWCNRIEAVDNDLHMC